MMSNLRKCFNFSPTGLKCPRLGNAFGFTLLELVVTLAIGAIVLTIAGLTLQNVARRHAAEELISELHVARFMAIRQHRQVSFIPSANTSRGLLQWQDDAGIVQTKTIDLGSTGERFVFDPNPPGGPPAPDGVLLFSSLGFISTGLGNVAGNIYLTNQNNTRWFHIQTTIAGGIDLNRYNPQSGTWSQAY